MLKYTNSRLTFTNQMQMYTKSSHCKMSCDTQGCLHKSHNQTFCAVFKNGFAHASSFLQSSWQSLPLPLPLCLSLYIYIYTIYTHKNFQPRFTLPQLLQTLLRWRRVCIGNTPAVPVSVLPSPRRCQYPAHPHSPLNWWCRQLSCWAVNLSVGRKGGRKVHWSGIPRATSYEVAYFPRWSYFEVKTGHVRQNPDCRIRPWHGGETSSPPQPRHNGLHWPGG